MAQTYSDKKGNQHPTYAAAQMANVTIDAVDEAKKHTKLLENQNVALAGQARQQAKAQKRQNELAEEALELERERAAEEAEHRGKLERIEQERLQSDKDHVRFQRDVMVLESATDEERTEFFVSLDREDDPPFYNLIGSVYLRQAFERKPDLAERYRGAYADLREKAKLVASTLNEFRSLKGKTDAATRVLGLFSLLFYLGTACFMTNCSINKALLGGKNEDGDLIQPWGEGYFIALLVLIIGGLWFFLKNSVSVRNMMRSDQSRQELATLSQTHGDSVKVQADFEKFAEGNVNSRKEMILGELHTLTEPDFPLEERAGIADAVRRFLKDRMKTYPRRCRPSEEYLADDERLFSIFAKNAYGADLRVLECSVAHDHSSEAVLLEKATAIGNQMDDVAVSALRSAAIAFVNIGYEPKVGENFLKDAGYSVASGSA